MTRDSIKLFDMDDTRAVSPVIATILVVAITVILAAVIGSSVLGLAGVLNEPAPVVSLSVADASENAPPPQRSTNGEITNWAEISHNNGKVINANDLKMIVRDSSGASVATFQESNSYSVSVGGDTLALYTDSSHSSPVDTTSTLAAGDTWYIVVDNGFPATVYEFPDGQHTVIIVHEPSQSIIAQSNVTIS